MEISNSRKMFAIRPLLFLGCQSSLLGTFNCMLGFSTLHTSMLYIFNTYILFYFRMSTFHTVRTTGLYTTNATVEWMTVMPLETEK